MKTTEPIFDFLEDEEVQNFLTEQRSRIKDFLNRHVNQMQRQKRARRKTWKGLATDEREKRNQEIRAAFKGKKPSITPNCFYKKQAKKHGLSPSQIRNIVNS
jgi:hypothetical protein